MFLSNEEFKSYLRLTDCSQVSDGASAVQGFEADAKQFLADIKDMGCTVCTCAEAFA